MGIMKLPVDIQVIQRLPPEKTLVAIWVRRQAIRYHRDQVGDDRCWLDDWLVWQFLEGAPPIPPWSEWKWRCEQFYEHRNSDRQDTLPFGAIINPDLWDQDLWHPRKMDADHLKQELFRVQEAIAKHLHISGRPRTFQDDKELYAVLPEKLAANFELPSREEFLGEALAPKAGCPAFRRSHEFCDPKFCTPHRWGFSR